MQDPVLTAHWNKLPFEKSLKNFPFQAGWTHNLLNICSIQKLLKVNAVIWMKATLSLTAGLAEQQKRTQCDAAALLADNTKRIKNGNTELQQF